ncbi:MAG: ABC transporter permease [Myxococcales bacterium]|nr:ABC transporter permease [Myxococcales bacterium]
MNDARLLVRLLGVSMRSQLQYRASMVMQSVGHLLVTGIEFLGVWALFARFGQLDGWTLAEVAVFYGVVNVSFALADAGGRGFDQVAARIKQGDFDRLLLRPRSTALQVAGLELTLKRIGRLSQGLAGLIWGLSALGVGWGPGRVALLAWIVVGATSMFYGLMVVQATIAFWTTESLELMNVLTYGGVETAQYPMSVYRRWFRRVFTYVVPLACVCYLPVLALIERPDPLGAPLWAQRVAPAAGLVFLAGALALWRGGVRRYTSTGS